MPRRLRDLPREIIGTHATLVDRVRSASQPHGSIIANLAQPSLATNLQCILYSEITIQQVPLVTAAMTTKHINSLSNIHDGLADSQESGRLRPCRYMSKSHTLALDTFKESPFQRVYQLI
jgi:hypothetical protein